jgi:hypothetical protein
MKVVRAISNARKSQHAPAENCARQIPLQSRIAHPAEPSRAGFVMPEEFHPDITASLAVAFLEQTGAGQRALRGLANIACLSLWIASRLGPPMNEADVWRTAKEMIEQYGGEARERARARAEKLREYGIADGYEEWIRVADAIAELERKAPDGNEKIN